MTLPFAVILRNLDHSLSGVSVGSGSGYTEVLVWFPERVGARTVRLRRL